MGASPAHASRTRRSLMAFVSIGRPRIGHDRRIGVTMRWRVDAQDHDGRDVNKALNPTASQALRRYRCP